MELFSSWKTDCSCTCRVILHSSELLAVGKLKCAEYRAKEKKVDQFLNGKSASPECSQDVMDIMTSYLENSDCLNESLILHTWEEGVLYGIVWQGSGSREKENWQCVLY